jgi:uncharacterized membrane protein YfcA
VIDLPDSTLFANLLADRRFAIAAGAAALAGLVRGFSGFGSALIYMPLVAAVYDPRTAAVTLLLIDLFASAPFTIREFPRAAWREVVPVWIAATVAVPFGTWALLVMDPIALRWGIAVLVLGLLAVLMSGWRYRGRPHIAATAGVGAFAGFGAGAVGIAGPAVIIYWLGGGANNAATVRANLMVFFTLLGASLMVAYGSQGLFTRELVALSILLGVFYLAAIGIGAWFFKGASENLYRRVAYAIVAVAALLSLPVFDGLTK